MNQVNFRFSVCRDSRNRPNLSRGRREQQKISMPDQKRIFCKKNQSKHIKLCSRKSEPRPVSQMPGGQL